MGTVFLHGNGSGGGTGGTLVVTAPAGVTVEVSKDGRTKRKTSSAEGLATFKGLATGVWTVTITDGQQTSTKTVNITADYSIAIAFFAATISIKYPAGSTCTCSDGKTTLTAPDTSGTWACIVPNTGTWTVSCTNGSTTASATVSITADGQSKTATLAYELVIFQSGKGAVQTQVTKKGENGIISVSSSKITVDYQNEAGWSDVVYYTKNKINTSGYKTLRLTGKFTEVDSDQDYVGFGLMSSVPITDNFGVQDWVSSKEISSASGSSKVYDCPISGSGSYYFVFAAAACVGEITDIRLIK